MAGLSGAIAWPLSGLAQQPAKVPRIGFLATAQFDTSEFREARDPFLQGMRELGYVEGQNFIVEYRSAEGRQERFASLAIDLVRINVDLIVALATPHARAAQQATRTIPIVVPAMSDPVADGLVASLARPGGNITGLTTLGAELTPNVWICSRRRFPACPVSPSSGIPVPPTSKQRARPGRRRRQQQPVCACSSDG